VKPLDRFIRSRRISRAAGLIRPGSRVLDIGCHDGELFRVLGPALREGVGLDPDLAGPLSGPNYALHPGRFPSDAPDDPESFDSACALAVLEHVHDEEREAFAQCVTRLLRPGGELVLTVPSPAVDGILDVLMRFGVLDGMEADQHHGFQIREVEPLFTGAGLRLERHETFQLGLNHLFVFRKVPS
jgi:SAM-dependent methyltransferase